MIVLPDWFFSRATSPVIGVAFQVVSRRLAEATNLGSRLIVSRYGSPVTCDQAAANFSYVTRPGKNASTSASWACAYSLFSSSQYGSAHSSGEPTTPSSDTSVASISFLIHRSCSVPAARRTDRAVLADARLYRSRGRRKGIASAGPDPPPAAVPSPGQTPLTVGYGRGNAQVRPSGAPDSCIPAGRITFRTHIVQRCSHRRAELENLRVGQHRGR
jgi:hypothetical protein